MQVQRTCLHCSNSFLIHEYYINVGRGKYCSAYCGNRFIREKKINLKLSVDIVEYWVVNPDKSLAEIARNLNTTYHIVNAAISKYIAKPEFTITLQSKINV